MRLARTILFTRNMEAMGEFYGRVLGLKQIGAEKRWLEFDAGGTTVALHAGTASPGRRGPKLVFHAKDVAAMRAVLIARGARFGKVCRGETVSFCDGRDPDGNPISLSDR
jgi:catechol 2,3-dioxygenase-like lactoylglutathione lyase family enzyme